MKKLIILFLVLACLLLTGCGNQDKFPRVEIIPTLWTFDSTFLPLRPHHVFAEVPYSITDTENGYDIIIHCVKEIE